MLYTVSREARLRLETVGGWRRTCVRRKRRWPSFILWRWAGPALDGWIRCRWRTPLLRRPLPHPHRTATITSLRPVPGRPVRRERPPRNRPPESRPGNPARNPARRRQGGAPRRAPRRPPGDPRPRRPPRNRLANRPRRASGGHPSAGNQPGRARPGQGPGSGQRRVAGGASLRLAPALESGKGGGAVDQCNVRKGLREVPQELPAGRVDLLRVEPDVVGVP